MKFTKRNEPVHEFAEKAMIRYGTEVVENRAVPDYRDGLKPVQRAILWAMYNLNLHHTGPYKKSARTVGEVIGSYWPHGDASVYDTMARMANFATPLIDGYGNWGTNVDSPAAQRYCFVSGTRIMTEFGLIPIEEIVEFSNKEYSEELPINLQVASLEPNCMATKWLHSGIHETVRVRTKLGYETQCTPNQPFYVFNTTDYNFEWKIASELTETDVLCLGCNDFGKNVIGDLDCNTAFYLGLLTRSSINEGKTLFYTETYKSRFDTFRRKTAEFFGISEEDIQFREKDGKYSFLYHMTESQSNKLEDMLDVSSWNEYTSHAPEPIFRANFSAVCSFLKAIFMQYRRIRGDVLSLSIRSKQLLQDVKQLLLNYAHIPTTAIQETQSWFSIEILDVEKAVDLGFIKSDKLIAKPYTQRLLGFDDWINAEILYSIEQGKALEYTSILRSLSDVVGILRRQLASNTNTLYADESTILKLKRIVDHNFVMDTIDSVTPGKSHHVYDLTVPKTHAFVAAGFVSHNTEARLSKFSDLILLDRDYLAVTEMIPNYSEDKQVPLVLPAKLPVSLIIGNVSIAVGIAASSPPFRVEGVHKLVSLILQGKNVSEKECLKYLDFNYRYGGVCVSGNNDLEALFKTGKGSVLFEPEYHYDAKKKEFLITSVCPGLTSMNSIETLFRNVAEIDGVKSIDDRSDKKIEICFAVTFGRVSDDKVKAAVASIKKLLVKSERYDMGVLDKTKTKTVFGRESIVTLLHKWVKWRVELELRVLNYKKDVKNQELEKLKLLLFTINNLSIIIKALEQKDSEAYLMSKLRIDREKADMIMDLKLRQVKKLEKPRVEDSIDKKNAEISYLEKYIKTPEKSVINDLDSLQKSL